MNTTAVNIRTELYNHAADYARRHNTSIDSMMENYILALMSFMPFEEKFDSPVIDESGEYAGGTKEKLQKRPISEETKRLLPKRRIDLPDDYKALMEQRLKEKYESLS